MIRCRYDRNGEITRQEGSGEYKELSVPRTSLKEMSIPFLTWLEENGSHSLAFAQYPRDYQATRDRSFETGALFTFKDLIDETIRAPTGTKRGALRRYMTTLFGEVDVVLDLVRELHCC
jgi:hypothetical protein